MASKPAARKYSVDYLINEHDIAWAELVHTPEELKAITHLFLDTSSWDSDSPSPPVNERKDAKQHKNLYQAVKLDAKKAGRGQAISEALAELIQCQWAKKTEKQEIADRHWQELLRTEAAEKAEAARAHDERQRSEADARAKAEAEAAEEALGIPREKPRVRVPVSATTDTIAPAVPTVPTAIATPPSSPKKTKKDVSPNASEVDNSKTTDDENDRPTEIVKAKRATSVVRKPRTTTSAFDESMASLREQLARSEEQRLQAEANVRARDHELEQSRVALDEVQQKLKSMSDKADSDGPIAKMYYNIGIELARDALEWGDIHDGVKLFINHIQKEEDIECGHPHYDAAVRRIKPFMLLLLAADYDSSFHYLAQTVEAFLKALIYHIGAALNDDDLKIHSLPSLLLIITNHESKLVAKDRLSTIGPDKLNSLKKKMKGYSKMMVLFDRLYTCYWGRVPYQPLYEWTMDEAKELALKIVQWLAEVVQQWSPFIKMVGVHKLPAERKKDHLSDSDQTDRERNFILRSSPAVATAVTTATATATTTAVAAPSTTTTVHACLWCQCPATPSPAAATTASGGVTSTP